MTQTVWIIGGTGMLANASRDIARQGHIITLIARAPEILAAEIGARPMPMDWNKPSSIHAACDLLQASPPPDIIVSWIHDRGIGCLSGMEKLLCPGGRSIRVHGSAAGNPQDGIAIDPAPPPHIVRQNIVLGWMQENQRKRWLTHGEISAGVADLVRRPDLPHAIIGVIQ